MSSTNNVTELNSRLPTPDEVLNASEAATALVNALSEDGILQVGSKDSDAPIRLAPAIGALFIELLGQVSKGNMVTIVPTGAMLTTQSAADILNVSRPFLSNLLKDGKINFVQVGTHRRVKFDDLMNYKKDRDSNRQSALDNLARLGQEYDES